MDAIGKSVIALPPRPVMVVSALVFAIAAATILAALPVLLALFGTGWRPGRRGAPPPRRGTPGTNRAEGPETGRIPVGYHSKQAQASAVGGARGDRA